jgi:hypothetical protein
LEVYLAHFLRNPRRSLLILVFFFLLFRIPLLDRPLQHDEIYKTSVYLRVSPFSKLSPEHADGGLTWANDWRRQLSIHPPFTAAVYYFWIKAFGDSEISLRLPSILAGLISIIFFYFFLILVFDHVFAFWVSLATVISVSSIGYSTMAVHAVFESMILSVSLFCLARALLYNKKGALAVLFMVNMIGALVFYHYFVYIFVQTLIFWRYRRELFVPRTYFVIVTAVFLGALALIAQSYKLGYLEYNFWLENNVWSLLQILALLPFNFPVERLGSSLTGQLTGVICFILLGFFYLGCVSVVREFKKERTARNLLKMIVLAVLVIPFICYLFAGILGFRLGNQRNFYYLLPRYYIFVFAGLRFVFINQKKRLFVKEIIAVVLILLAVVSSVVFHSYKAVEKRMVELGSALNAEVLFFATDDSFIHKYYAEKYGITGKSFVLYIESFDENGSEKLFGEYLNKNPACRSFAVISKPYESPVDLKNEYTVNGRVYRLVSDDLYNDRRIPLPFFDKLLKNARAIKVSLFKEVKNPE